MNFFCKNTNNKLLSLSLSLKADRLRPEIRADIEKLITDGQQGEKEPAKLAVLRSERPPLADTAACQCRPVRHTSGDQCRRERAAQIIQRTYRRFHRRKRPGVAKKPSMRSLSKPGSRLSLGKTLDSLEKPDKRSPTIKPKLFGKSSLADKRTNDKRSVERSLDSEGSSIDGQLADRLALKEQPEKEQLKWKRKLKQDKILMSQDKSKSKSKDRSGKAAGKESGKKSRKDSRKELSSGESSKEPSKDSADKESGEESVKGSAVRPKADEKPKHRRKSRKSSTTRSKRKVDQRPDASKSGYPALLPAPVGRSREENETGHLAASAKEASQRPQRTEQLILYSDSINPEFCGFFICNFNAAASAASSTSIAQPESVTWQRHFQFNHNAKRLIAPYDAAVVSHGQSIYLVGGMQMKSTNFYVSDQVIRYQLNSRQLQRVLTLRTPRVQHSAVVAGDRLYVICGCKATNRPVNTVECIHLMSATRPELISLPKKTFGRFGQSAVYFRSRLWIIGGIAKIDNNFHLLSEIWVLDVQNRNKWIKSKFPVPIAFAGICSVKEEFIYVVGGRCVGLNGKLQPSEKVWCYSAASRRWQQVASLNQPRCNCCCVSVGERIYAFGGSPENDPEHLRGQSGEFYEPRNANQGWRMLNKNLPASISGQSVTKISFF